MDYEEEALKRLKERAEQYIKYCEENNLEKPKDTATQIAVKQYMHRINCGGHALEIDNRFFPNEEELSNYVSGLLDRFNFIRLLGDEPLHDDEYLVFYRFMEYEKNQGRNEGHHFIKVEDDGLVTEKFGDGELQIFQGWHEKYKNSPEVVFAVKKNHEHFFDSRLDLTDFEGGLNFEETVSKAIDDKNNSFSYHSHNYRLKKLPNGNAVVIDKNEEVVASILKDGVETAVEILEGKEEYVENLSGPVEPIIQNGKLINFNDFKEKSKEEKDR